MNTIRVPDAWAIAVVLMCCLPSIGHERDKDRKDLGVSVSVSGPNVSILGGPIGVTVIARKHRGLNDTMLPNEFGLPFGLGVRVVDVDSEAIVSRRGASHGFVIDDIGAQWGRGPMKSAPWRAKESLQFECDLDLHFKIDQPGNYRLEVHSGPQVFAAHNFAVSELQDRASTIVRGKCAHPLYGVVYDDADDAGLGVRCMIQTGRVENETKENRWVAIVGNLFIGVDTKPPRFGERSPARFSSLILDVPSNCSVEKSALDFKWQLWTILATEEERALVVWDLRCGTTKVLVPWGKHDLDLDAAQREKDGPSYVIGGLRGETKFTTSSLTPASDTTAPK